MNIVWLVNNYPNEYNNFTGGLFFERMATELASRDVNLKVIQPVPLVFWPLSKIEKYKNLPNLPKYEKRGQIEIYRPKYIALPRQHYLGMAHWLIFLSLLQYDFWKNINIVDGKYSYPNGSVANLLKKWFGVKSVISCIGSDVAINIKISWINRFLQQKNFRLADKIICVNDELGKIVEEISGQSFETVYDGIYIEGLTLRDKVIDEKIKCIYIGELSREKGTHILSSLLREYPKYISHPFEWHIIGGGSNDFGLSDFPNVKLYGSLPNNNVLEILNQCNFLVFPSLSEGIPNVIKEAALLRVPVVASEVGGVPAYLGNGERGFLFKSENVAQLNEKLTIAINDSKNTFLKSEKLFQYTLTNFGINRI